MLARNTYEQSYIDGCRKIVDYQVSTYDGVAKATSDEAALGQFQPVFFNNMVILLDSLFAHRQRGTEGKDGNPINEVTMLREAMVEHHGVFTENKTMKLKPENSVLGIAFGDYVTLSQRQFTKISEAFFKEIEARFA